MRETWWLAHAGALEPSGALGRHGLVSVAAATAPRPGALRLSSDRQSAAVLLPGPPPLLLKWRHPHGVRRVLKAFVRPSRERREAASALAARARGIATPAPLAVAERREGGRLLGAVLVRPYFARMVPADRLLAEGGGPALAQALTQALRRWHDLGLRHGDAYPKNVLVDPGTGEAWPIGFPSAHLVRPGPRVDGPRLADLAQWAAGLAAPDPLAFLAAYARVPGLPPLADLAARVAPLHAAVMARKARRLATRPEREPHGPPAPPPLPVDARPVQRRLRPLAELGPDPPARPEQDQGP